MLHETIALFAKSPILGTVNNEVTVEAPEWQDEIRSRGITRNTGS